MNNTLRKGFTLTEILLVVTLIICLMVVAMLSVSGQIGRAQDTQAKAAMAQLKRVFEEYYSDHNCYPPIEWFDGPEDCGANMMKPYLEVIPCDVRTKKPYQLLKDSSGCKSYGLYTRLSQPTGNSYCVDQLTYNYFIGSNNAIPQYVCPLNHYCQSVGNCQQFDTSVWDCGPAYVDDLCTGSDACTMTGSCSLRGG
jgi:type II secretory pathway pseudopilin PulG